MGTHALEDLMYVLGDIFHAHAGDDKLLDKKELKIMMSKELPEMFSEEESAKLLAKLDHSGDGKVTFEEFVMNMAGLCQFFKESGNSGSSGELQDVLKSLIGIFDDYAGGDSHLDTDELKKLVSEQLPFLDLDFSELDDSESGPEKVSFGEFVLNMAAFCHKFYEPVSADGGRASRPETSKTEAQKQQEEKNYESWK